MTTALQLLGPSTGGIRVHVATLARHLEDLGVDAPVVGPAGVLDGLGATAGTVEVPDGLSPARLLAARRQLRTWRRSSTLVHAHGLKAAWVAVRGRPALPLVVTVHNVVLDGPSGPAQRLRRRLEAEVLARADRVIAPTQDIADGLSTSVRRESVRIVVPASPPPEIERSRSEIRHTLGVSDDTPLVVCVARLHPQKDLPTLLRAWTYLRRVVPDAHLAIVGEGPDRESLMRFADGEGIGGSVTFVGFDPHAVDWIAACDVMALSSVWEAIPLVLVEAMQLGVPVVSTDVGLASDLLGDGRAGHVAAIGDPEELAEGLGRFLADPAAAADAGAEARRRSADRFDPVVLSSQVAEVYSELVGPVGATA